MTFSIPSSRPIGFPTTRWAICPSLPSRVWGESIPEEPDRSIRSQRTPVLRYVLSTRRGAVTNASGSALAERLSVGGIELEVVRRGTGRPLLLLHGAQTVDPRARFLDLLGAHAEIIAPSHPGFGHSPRPADFETVYDLVHFYLEVLEALPHEKVTLLGLSFGGWLAAEVAVKCHHRLDGLILVDAFGIKISDRETPDILDVFNTSPQEVRRRSWHDPEAWALDFNALSDDQLVVRARNWEALCLYGWHPYMYNPQLKRWLRRITVPTLVLWGASDGIVTPSYGRAYSELIPGSRFGLIERAGHHPEIEQAEAFVDAVVKFLNR
ncbi:MAG: alpha/beta hydrolase [Candidatus Rokuibacteriota bacterium]|nr:MAG: alpha/beta hydrolase [Candidatus Rokubacteria bacterium]